jgi:hypothetical protein
MTAYSKTMAGRMAAVDQKSFLTPAMKTFLKSVDGKTPSEQLLLNWGDASDARRLLQELVNFGFIEIRAERWTNSQAPSSFNSSAHTLTQPVLPAAGPVAGSAVDNSPATTSPPTAELDAIKEEMATFILTHLPQHAVPVLKEIEDINSHQKLQAMLVGYANLAHDAGRTGLAHIKSLRGMLQA